MIRLRESLDKITKMLSAVENIELSMENISSEELLGETAVAKELLKNIEILGKTSEIVSNSTKEKNSHIQWKELERFCSFMIEDEAIKNRNNFINTFREYSPLLKGKLKILIKNIERA